MWSLRQTFNPAMLSLTTACRTKFKRRSRHYNIRARCQFVTQRPKPKTGKLPAICPRPDRV